MYVTKITPKQIGQWYRCSPGGKHAFAKVLECDGIHGKSVSDQGVIWDWTESNLEYRFLAPKEVCGFCDLPREVCKHQLRCAECEDLIDSIDYLCSACRPK